MSKSIKQTFILALCVLLPSLVKAANRSVDDAKEIAAEFFQTGDVSRLGSKDSFILAHTVVDEASNPICYVFNAKDGKGFAIVSVDESAMPVVGYSADSAWEAKMIPGAAKQLVSSPIVMSTDSRRRVSQMRAGASGSKILATPSWSQEAPFNFNIPNRRLTGCVGVALAEILKYHGYPASRPASLVNSGESSVYDWNSMRSDNYRSGYGESEAAAVATLVADAAVAIGTDFGMSSSSAFEVKVPHALVSLFGYDAGVSYKKRSEMQKADWDKVIIGEIDANRPVLYSGQDVSSGHAFVCDGYEMRGGIPYFHINWGWGGSANGYYASDALNPVVSKAHSYNDLMTIVYNIKPAANATVWSPIHVTSDEAQPGLTINVSDIASAGTFSLRAGALKNISNSDFSGKLAVALFDASGTRKGFLNNGRNFSLIALQISKYVDFNCQVPSGMSVANGDVVRLVTQANGSSDWLPVSGDLLAPGEAAAKAYAIPYFQISLPATTGDYTVTADAAQVIKGRDFSFTLTSLSPQKVITVRSNGFILTPDANNVYKITNVLEDKNVDVIVQNAADVLTKATIWVTAGNLQNLLTDEQCASVKDLTLFGTINASDFNFMRDRMKLNRLDISQTSVVAQGSNPANAIPAKAFQGYRSLQEIILPSNIVSFKNGCFAQTGLRSIEIPASVATWEYNIFVSCNALKEIISRRKTPAWVNWCVFSGVPKSAKLVVPVGSANAYSKKEYWADFTNVVEEDAIAPDHYKVAVSENKHIRFAAQSEGAEFAPGASYVFAAEPDESFGDATVEVYANSTRLSPDANGNYSAKINANTLIHFEFKQPEATTPDTSWKLTADAGGVGLATEVVNVMPGKSFTVRANAIKIPAGADGSKFFAMVLTDKDGAIKEFISPVYNGSTVAAGNQSFNFGCQVVDATVKEGNLIRLATSYNKKTWNLVGAEKEGVCDRLSARNNQVVYHNISMPQTVTGARIEGVATQAVHGMPFTVKVTPSSPVDRVTLSVNGVNKALSQSVANVTIPAVTEDLDIAIQIHPAGASDFVVVNVNEGELASKLDQCPARLKVSGTMLVSDFDALRAKASTIIDLDLSDVTIKGAAMTANSIPENAFAPKSAGASSALKSVILPSNLERIDQNAFARCLSITEISIPASVTFIGNGAFAQCTGLKKIIMEGSVPPATGTMSPLPSNASGITLEVPRGFESAYTNAAYWKEISPKAGIKIFGIKIDTARSFSYSSYIDLSKFEFKTDSYSKQTVSIGLPNCQKRGITEGLYRPGQVFKVYDNGQNVDFLAADEYGYGGQYSVEFNPVLMNYGDQYVNHKNYPQNHTIDVVFFYPISFEFGEGAEGTKAEVKNTEGGEVYNAPNNKFVYGTSGNKMTYREDRNYKISLEAPASGIEYTVEVEQNVMLKPAKGNSPAQMEIRKTTILPDEQGLYTIESLQGDAKVLVTGKVVVEEGTPIPADVLAAVSKDNVEEFTELAVTGEMNEADFESIRYNFESVETLDLSQIENDVIPAGAFAGMESLNTVIIPETVTEIGAGAFAGCDNIETITLPGVTSIGEGAFEGCENLTSILLPSLGASESGMMKARARSNAKASEGITVESFSGLNPNCLIYVGASDIADAESLNIILNVDGTRVAASDIILDGNHPFNAPASFLLGDHRISFTLDVAGSNGCEVDGGWTTLMLPFTPTHIEYGEEFADRKGSGIHLMSFDDENSETLTPQTVILPNRPYLANVSAPYISVPVTFTAKAIEQSDEIVYDVPFTPVPEMNVAKGKNYSLYGSFDGETRIAGHYVLNEEGSAFVKPAEGEESSAVRPFSAYLCANDGEIVSSFAIGNHPIWIADPYLVGDFGKAFYRTSKIELASGRENAEMYYTVDGTDPADENGTRRLYEGPIAMEGENMTIKAVAEYNGSLSDIVSYDFELKKTNIDYALGQNWTWISHNMENSVKLSDFVSEGVSRVVGQTKEAVVDPKLGLVGNLTQLEPGVGYKVCVSGENWSGSVAGIAYDPSQTVKLNRGWNWIGNPVIEGSNGITDLFSGLEAEEGDMIVGLEGFSQYVADEGWKGTLVNLVPGLGYMYHSNSDKQFVYNVAPASGSVQSKAASREDRWSVDIHKYPSVMPLTATLINPNGFEADADDYDVAAFCGDECRGVGVKVDGKIMINVHGVAGDKIGFRYVGSDGVELQSATVIPFDEEVAYLFSNPLEISLASTTAVGSLGGGSLMLECNDGSLILKGDVPSDISLEVYDLSGKMITKSSKIESGSVRISELAEGIYMIVIRGNGTSINRKVMVK